MNECWVKYYSFHCRQTTLWRFFVLPFSGSPSLLFSYSPPFILCYTGQEQHNIALHECSCFGHSLTAPPLLSVDSVRQYQNIYSIYISLMSDVPYFVCVCACGTQRGQHQMRCSSFIQSVTLLAFLSPPIRYDVPLSFSQSPCLPFLTLSLPPLSTFILLSPTPLEQRSNS